MKAINKSYSFEMKLPSTVVAGTKLNVPDIAYLRDKTIIGVESSTSDILSKCPSGNTNLNITDSGVCLVTLQDINSKQLYSQIPLNRFNPMIYGGIWLENTPVKINWTKCFIEFTGVIENSTTKSVLITVYYL